MWMWSSDWPAQSWGIWTSRFSIFLFWIPFSLTTKKETKKNIQFVLKIDCPFRVIVIVWKRKRRKYIQSIGGKYIQSIRGCHSFFRRAVKLNHCHRSLQFENYSRKLQTIQNFLLCLKSNTRKGNDLVLMWKEVFTWNTCVYQPREIRCRLKRFTYDAVA